MSLKEFGPDIGRLERLSYPEVLEEFVHQISDSSLIDGIKDVEYQETLRFGRHQEMKEAVINALEFEKAKKATQQLRKSWTLQTKL